MKNTTLYFRIYLKGKPMRHVGMVEANSITEATEKAIKGTWKSYWGTDAERPSSPELITAVI